MVNRVLDHLEEWLITFLIGAATLIIFLAVVHRYTDGIRHRRSSGCPTEDRHVVGAGTDDLHVRLDGQVRRRLRRADRHPRRSRRADQRAERSHARLVRPLRPAGRRTFHRHHRQLRRALCLGADAHRAGVGRPGTAQVDRLCLHPAGLVPDVLPLPAGGVELPQDGAPAARRSRPCRRPRQGRRDRMGQAAVGSASR